MSATADAIHAGGARPPGFAKHTATTESALTVSPGDAGSSGSRAGGTTRGVGVPKITCKGKVEVVKNILRSETLSGRENRAE